MEEERKPLQIEPTADDMLRPSSEVLTSMREKKASKSDGIINLIDTFMGGPGVQNPEELSPVDIARKPIRAGMLMIVVVFGVFGLWSVLAPIDSAAVAPGQVVLDFNKKTIQHLEGGIIKEILVREGEEVKADQPLVRLDEVQAKAQLNLYSTQYYTALAAEARLVAERDEKQTINFPKVLVDKYKESRTVQEIVNNQQRLFKANREALEGQISVLKQRIEQTGEEINGLGAQISSANQQIGLLNQEIAVVQKLLAQGNASRPRLLDRQRQRAGLAGQRGNNQALISRAKQRISEDKIQIVNVRSEAQKRINAELKETQDQISDLKERIRSSADVLQRGVIRSPISGIVNGLEVFTVGGVIEPGAKLMDIIPFDDELIVEARISIQDIDVVRKGLEATVRLSAFGARSVPPVSGKVFTVSADRFDDERTGEAYYIARIHIDEEQLNKLEGVELTPGMGADVLIRTGSRTLFAYLMKPISDGMNKAFREE